MVVEVVNEFGIRAIKTEDHSPVATDGKGPVTGQLPFERMQANAWHVDLIRAGSLIQYAQHQGQPFRMRSPSYFPS